MLRLEHLSCGYGPIEAVHDLSLEIGRGEVFALLGPNGAGKTTTLMAIMGHATVQAGRILLRDVDITERPALERPRLGVALVPEGRQLFTDLSVEENLTVGGYARPRRREADNRARVFELFPRLGERRRQIAGSMSGGEQQMLAMGRALMAEPELLLIDELSLGLMPKMVDACFAALARLQQDGLTILLVEQNTARALAIADKVCILSAGAVAFQGSAAEARADEALFASFLGPAA
jgi:branched-chain amino acid transport system ATP-binding protein